MSESNPNKVYNAIQEIVEEKMDETEEQKKITEKMNLMVIGKQYYFIIGENCYLGTYESKDRFVSENFILNTNEKEFSLPIEKIFNSKDECVSFMKKNYKDKGYPYNNINFINC